MSTNRQKNCRALGYVRVKFRTNKEPELYGEMRMFDPLFIYADDGRVFSMKTSNMRKDRRIRNLTVLEE